VVIFYNLLRARRHLVYPLGRVGKPNDWSRTRISCRAYARQSSANLGNLSN